MDFRLVSESQPIGDQPRAVDQLVEGLNRGDKEQTPPGVTGPGKTLTMANVTAGVNWPTLVPTRNKTLVAQLCSEFREFFPENSVEYFVSYYDYYQPEAYIPMTDTYIEKDSAINDEIDKPRHSATTILSERRDVIIMASVSCIYSLSNPIDYHTMVVSLHPGMQIKRDDLLKKLVELQYEWNDVNFVCNKLHVHGDMVEIFPIQSNENTIRVGFFRDETERISETNVLTSELKAFLKHVAIFPASYHIVPREKMMVVVRQLEQEVQERVKLFELEGKPTEAQCTRKRTMYDVEVLQEIGFCKEVENYSHVLSGHELGSVLFILFDYLLEDFPLFVDEFHVSLPRVRSIYVDDRARKGTLINLGFHLPSTYGNRPLNFSGFYERADQTILVSAMPGDLELQKSAQIVEQVVRSTGLADPEVIVGPIEGQIGDLTPEINLRSAKSQRVLVTTLIKKMAKGLTVCLENMDIRVRYMHHGIDTVERMETTYDLRLGEFDILAGINLLRKSIDLPEVSLVAILDADKEGFLRSERSLIQTTGCAARNSEGQITMYADSVTPPMGRALHETQYRRGPQQEYNEKYHTTPRTAVKNISDVLEISTHKDEEEDKKGKYMSATERKQTIEKLIREMKVAAKPLEFEYAAYLCDKIKQLSGGKQSTFTFKQSGTDITASFPRLRRREAAGNLFKRCYDNAAQSKRIQSGFEGFI